MCTPHHSHEHLLLMRAPARPHTSPWGSLISLGNDKSSGLTRLPSQALPTPAAGPNPLPQHSPAPPPLGATCPVTHGTAGFPLGPGKSGAPYYCGTKEGERRGMSQQAGLWGTLTLAPCQLGPRPGRWERCWEGWGRGVGGSSEGGEGLHPLPRPAPLLPPPVSCQVRDPRLGGRHRGGQSVLRAAGYWGLSEWPLLSGGALSSTGSSFPVDLEGPGVSAPAAQATLSVCLSASATPSGSQA